MHIHVHSFTYGPSREHPCWFTGRTSRNSRSPVFMRSPSEMPNIFGSVFLWGLMRSQKGKCPRDITIEINQKTSSWGNALAGMNQMSATCRLQKVLPIQCHIWITISRTIPIWVKISTGMEKGFLELNVNAQLGRQQFSVFTLSPHIVCWLWVHLISFGFFFSSFHTQSVHVEVSMTSAFPCLRSAMRWSSCYLPGVINLTNHNLVMTELVKSPICTAAAQHIWTWSLQPLGNFS